jgi:ADP-ribosylglycohydrolase
MTKQEFDDLYYRIKSSVYGFIIGDVLGVPYEFKSPEEMKVNPCIGIISNGTHNQPLGSWSDDTSLMLCTMEALSIPGKSIGEYILEIKKNFVKWYDEGYWTSHGKVFDCGATTHIKNGVEPSGLFSDKDNGNGALMRMLPLVFIVKDDDIYTLNFARKIAAITHGHNTSLLCCEYYIDFIKNTYRNSEVLTALNYPDRNEIYKYFHPNEEPDENSSLWKLYKYMGLSENDKFKIPFKPTGFVVDTLHNIWKLSHKHNGEFWQSHVSSWVNEIKYCYTDAVNLGGDTDTLAALYGAFLGKTAGYNNLPKDWLDVIPHKHRIDELCMRFAMSIYYNNNYGKI